MVVLIYFFSTSKPSLLLLDDFGNINKRIILRTITQNYATRIPKNGSAVIREIDNDNAICTNSHVVSNSNPTNDLGSSSNIDIIPDLRGTRFLASFCCI